MTDMGSTAGRYDRPVEADEQGPTRVVATPDGVGTEDSGATQTTSEAASSGAAGTASGRAGTAGGAAASSGTARGAEDEASYGQVLGTGIEVPREAAEAGAGEPATGARRDADGNPVA
jgi:hypothetical protein